MKTLINFSVDRQQKKNFLQASRIISSTITFSFSLCLIKSSFTIEANSKKFLFKRTLFGSKNTERFLSF